MGGTWAERGIHALGRMRCLRNERTPVVLGMLHLQRVIGIAGATAGHEQATHGSGRGRVVGQHTHVRGLLLLLAGLGGAQEGRAVDVEHSRLHRLSP